MRVINSIIGLASFFMVVACQNQDGSMLKQDLSNQDLVKEITDSIKPNPQEINRVIQVFLKQNKKELSRANCVSINKIGDDKNLIYVVNFLPSNGFLLISGTKNSFPILAYSENGNFEISKMPDALKVWSEGAFEAMDYLNSHPQDTTAINSRRFWRKFENNEINFSDAISRSDKPSIPDNETLNQLYRIQLDSMSRWDSDPNVEYMTIERYKKEYPEQWSQIESEFKEYIEPDYLGVFEDVSLVVFRSDHSEFKVETVTTNWHQGNLYGDFDFNRKFPSMFGYAHMKAGCTTVAAAQIMHYYRCPHTYDWDAMPLDAPSEEIAGLFWDLAKVSNPEYSTDGGTAISLENMAKTLRNLGYEAKVSEFNNNKVGDLPIILDSDLIDSAGKKCPHSWILSGRKSGYYLTDVEYWTFTRPYQFNKAMYDSPLSNFTYAYDFCNWGFGGNFNGWYSDYLTAVPSVYIKNKPLRMMYNIKPIK